MVLVCVIGEDIQTVYSEVWFFFFQAEDGIRDLVRSRGLGDVYKRQPNGHSTVQRLHCVQPSSRTIGYDRSPERGCAARPLSLIHI